jgi:hypothetical protein
MSPYLISLAVGLGVGIIYGLLAGEAAVSYLRGHTDVTATFLHRKNFATDAEMQEKRALGNIRVTAPASRSANSELNRNVECKCSMPRATIRLIGDFHEPKRATRLDPPQRSDHHFG